EEAPSHTTTAPPTASLPADGAAVGSTGSTLTGNGGLSTSHASPAPSPSPSRWSALGTSRQLSMQSTTPSPSVSTASGPWRTPVLASEKFPNRQVRPSSPSASSRPAVVERLGLLPSTYWTTISLPASSRMISNVLETLGARCSGTLLNSITSCRFGAVPSVW